MAWIDKKSSKFEVTRMVLYNIQKQKNLQRKLPVCGPQDGSKINKKLEQ